MDYFSDIEREKQRRFAKMRDRAFMPLLSFLAKNGVRPNHVTVLGVGFLIAACICGASAAWAVPLFLIFYCLCDDLDGGLARHTRSNSEGGTLIDMVADQAGPVFISAAATYHLKADGIAAVLFSNSYIAFIALIVYANVKKIAIGLFVRVKYVLYGVYALSVLIQYDLATGFMYLFGAYHLCYIVFILRRIYGFYPIPGENNSQPD